MINRLYLVGIAKGWVEIRTATRRPVLKNFKLKKNYPIIRQVTGGSRLGVVSRKACQKWGLDCMKHEIVSIPLNVGKALLSEQHWRKA